MKLLLTTAAVGLLLCGSAIAAEPNPYTAEQINAALAALGQPPLQSGRVLHDDHANERKSTVITNSTVTTRLLTR